MKDDRGRTEKIPFKRAMTWILLSIVFVSGSTAFSVLYYFHVKELQIQDESFRIVAINQTGPEQGALSSQYLSELLNISVDQMTNIYQFNVEEGRNKLLSNPLIKTAEIKKSIPGTLDITYSLRKPVAYLSDFTNTFIDEEGVLLPIEPFSSLKELPEIFLGGLGDRIQWGDQLKSERCKKALALLRVFSEKWDLGSTTLKRIDLSKVEFPSYGMREIVVTVEEKIEQRHRILRLNPEELYEQLFNYRVLSGYLANRDEAFPEKPQPQVIDLRISNLAFISMEKNVSVHPTPLTTKVAKKRKDTRRFFCLLLESP